MSCSQTLFGLNDRLARRTHFAYRLLLPIMMMVPSSIGYRVYPPAQARAEEVASAGSLSFFADQQDAPTLLARLNADPEMAFIVPDGPRLPPPDAPMPPPSPPTGVGREARMVATFATCPWGADDYWRQWRAVRPVDSLKDGEHTLWHISAGPLARFVGREWHLIADPFVGWTTERPVCTPGLTPAATIRLKLVTRHAGYTAQEHATVRPLNAYWLKGDLLVASDFQWSAASLEVGGSLQTARWVAGLEDWFSRNAVALQARYSTEVFWAFPSALARLKSGIPYYSRGFELDESIRRAR
jgi:hypothetical protein